MTDRKIEPAWRTASWEGSRRAQLGAAVGLTLRQRLEALDGLIELARRLAEMPRKRAGDK